MLPQKNLQTIISATLRPGIYPEPGISNDSFLESYLDYSCWLRVINAWQSISVLSQDKAGKLERLAALAAFYQTAGLAVEDALSTCIAWAIWARDKNQSLADILARLSLRLVEPKQPVSPSYAEDVIKKFQTTQNRVDFYARPFLTQLLSVSDRELPKVFGIPWKPHPSVKLVPREMLENWNNLGFFMRESLVPLLDPKGALLASCYNKIKHGPQIMISDMATAARARGLSFEEGAMSELTVRLLLQGARTQETDIETTEEIRSAPFLLMNSANAKRWFFQHIVHTANALFIAGTWLYNSTYLDKKRSFNPALPEVQSIIREQGRYV